MKKEIILLAAFGALLIGCTLRLPDGTVVEFPPDLGGGAAQECFSSDDCAYNERCADGDCALVPAGECGTYSNHAWQDYECCASPDCGAGFQCTENECVPGGAQPECASDSECPQGYGCESGGCVELQPTPGCTLDSDCAEGFTCSGNVCVQIPLEQWGGVEMKFTYIGPQEKIVPSVGISVGEFDLAGFGGGTEGFDYSNDLYEMETFRVTEEEMRDSVLSVFSLEFMDSENAPEDPAVSFMVYDAGSGNVEEIILDSGQAGIVAEAIRDSLTTSIGDAGPLDIYG